MARRTLEWGVLVAVMSAMLGGIIYLLPDAWEAVCVCLRYR